MRAAAHWILVALTLGAWAVAIAFARGGASPQAAVAGWLFLALSIAMAAVDLVQRSIPAGSPRSIAWLLEILTAAFLPLLTISGAWSKDGESMIMLPAVAGCVVSWIGTPWLVSTGPQPSVKEGRYTPVLFSWLGLALAFALTSG